ncbi:hypothetical protein SEPL_362 [Salmonella phage SE_PL]|nr:hypothetical protein 7t3_0214 [Salmonella phage 7t3]QIG62975.1 hypothetical protein SEPL_362 [Salmonella phage SE_PL]
MIEEKHYEYARSLIWIEKLFQELQMKMPGKFLKYSPLMFSLELDKTDCIWYNDTPVIDFKVAWGEDSFNTNYLWAAENDSRERSIIIIAPNTKVYMANVDRNTNGTEYILDFDDSESFVFQMQLVQKSMWDEFCILYALHELGFSRPAFIHVWSQQVLDIIINKMEDIIRYDVI